MFWTDTHQLSAYGLHACLQACMTLTFKKRLISFCCNCREDFESAQGMSPSQQRQLWHDLASGAESGMDFTSRWFDSPDNISTIQTTKIIPAELNAYLYQMESNVAQLADDMGNSTLASSFRDFAAARKEAMNTLMYNETAGGSVWGV